MGLSGSQLWCIYGCLLRDPFLSWSSLTGTVINLYYVVTAIALLGILYGKTALANINADREQQKALNEDLNQLRNVQFGLTALLAVWGCMYVCFFVHQVRRACQASCAASLACCVSAMRQLQIWHTCTFSDLNSTASCPPTHTAFYNAADHRADRYNLQRALLRVLCALSASGMCVL